ncbi:hypothetical protein CHARACLAT_032539 [Characodon lateralis]|uniref:Uncharacterized protein n=1 Tax=Characodon lateralis TaxID=208331 RepID=A0ABU7CW56_9TELE|nr:hypothetical protein [Characodon lateralis]
MTVIQWQQQSSTQKKVCLCGGGCMLTSPVSFLLPGCPNDRASPERSGSRGCPSQPTCRGSIAERAESNTYYWLGPMLPAFLLNALLSFCLSPPPPCSSSLLPELSPPPPSPLPPNT